MAFSPFEAAINQICDEKGLSREIVVATIEAALAAAYRKDYGEATQVIKAKLNPEDIAKSEMFQAFEVVKKDELIEPERQMLVKDAKKIKKNAKAGDEILIPLPPKADFGRIAAQTAKQVIIQRLGEAEREVLYNEFKDKQGKLINATIQQVNGPNIVVNLGKINGIMMPSDQIPGEKYFISQRLKVFVSSVEESVKGPRVVVSRANEDFIKSLFELEVPEITTGAVTIEGIAREPGIRTKMAVDAHQEGLDPVGSCVGQRGIRVQSVLAEIGEEKIDIILYDKKPEQYITNALSPAKVEKIKLNKKIKKATVYVNEDQLSLAIGRNGQNVRLASKLTGWTLDIEKSTAIKKIKVPTLQSDVRDKKSRPGKVERKKKTEEKNGK